MKKYRKCPALLTMTVWAKTSISCGVSSLKKSQLQKKIIVKTVINDAIGINLQSSNS